MHNRANGIKKSAFFHFLGSQFSRIDRRLMIPTVFVPARGSYSKGKKGWVDDFKVQVFSTWNGRVILSLLLLALLILGYCIWRSFFVSLFKRWLISHSQRMLRVNKAMKIGCLKNETLEKFVPLFRTQFNCFFKHCGKCFVQQSLIKRWKCTISLITLWPRKAR